MITCIVRRDATRPCTINKPSSSSRKTLPPLPLFISIMVNNTWSSPTGLDDLQKIISSQVPWPAGPHDWQVMATARTLDGLNQLVVTACGDGKTAAAYLPLLVLEALSANRSLPRHGSRVPERPVVLMVTPLTDLGHSQVSGSPSVTI